MMLKTPTSKNMLAVTIRHTGRVKGTKPVVKGTQRTHLEVGPRRPLTYKIQNSIFELRILCAEEENDILPSCRLNIETNFTNALDDMAG